MTLDVRTRRAPKLLHGLAVAALAASLTFGMASSAEAGPRGRGDSGSRRPAPAAATPPGTHWLDVGPFDQKPRAVDPGWQNFKVEVVCGPDNDRLIKPRTDFVLYHDWGWADGRLNMKATAQKGHYFSVGDDKAARHLERFITDKNVCPKDMKVGDSMGKVEFKDTRSIYFDDYKKSVWLDSTFAGEAKPKPTAADDVAAPPQFQDKPVVVPEKRLNFHAGRLYWAQSIRRNVKVIEPTGDEKQIRVQWNESSNVVDVLGWNWEDGDKILLEMALKDGLTTSVRRTGPSACP